MQSLLPAGWSSPLVIVVLGSVLAIGTMARGGEPGPTVDGPRKAKRGAPSKAERGTKAKAKAKAKGGAGTVWELLEMGQYRSALSRLETRPGPLGPNSLVARGRALSGMSRCPEALSDLDRGRGAKQWTAQAASAEGHCRLILGDASGAVVAYQEAVFLDPDRPHPKLGLVLALAAADEQQEAQRALEALEDDPARGYRDVLARVRISVGDEAWWAIDELRELHIRQARKGSIQADLRAAELWMMLDDPLSAEALLSVAVHTAPSQPRAAMTRAEALRRLGEPEEALLIAGRPRVAGQPIPLRFAVLARAYADIGDLDAAEAALAEHPAPDHPDALASRWYLERARNPAEAARLAAIWRTRVRGPERLEHLVPVTDRAP